MSLFDWLGLLIAAVIIVSLIQWARQIILRLARSSPQGDEAATQEDIDMAVKPTLDEEERTQWSDLKGYSYKWATRKDGKGNWMPVQGTATSEAFLQEIRDGQLKISAQLDELIVEQKATLAFLKKVFGA